MAENKGWIGVDLDGTLAEYTGWQGIEHIGDPIFPMWERVKVWLADGQEVRIMTARVSQMYTHPFDANKYREAEDALEHINVWCVEHFGQRLPVTSVKDFGMIELWDDRCVTVELNTGKIILSPHANEPTP